MFKKYQSLFFKTNISFLTCGLIAGYSLCCYREHSQRKLQNQALNEAKFDLIAHNIFLQFLLRKIPENKFPLVYEGKEWPYRLYKYLAKKLQLELLPNDTTILVLSSSENNKLSLLLAKNVNENIRVIYLDSQKEALDLMRLNYPNVTNLELLHFTPETFKGIIDQCDPSKTVLIVQDAWSSLEQESVQWHLDVNHLRSINAFFSTKKHRMERTHCIHYALSHEICVYQTTGGLIKNRTQNEILSGYEGSVEVTIEPVAPSKAMTSKHKNEQDSVIFYQPLPAYEYDNHRIPQIHDINPW